MEKKCAIFVKSEKQNVPDPILELAALRHGNWFSATIAEQVEGRPMLSTITVNMPASKHAGGAIGEIKELLGEITGKKALICFSSEEQDPQPFTLLATDPEHIDLVVALDGDFSEDIDGTPADNHTVDYAFATDYLKSKIEELGDKAEGDISKLVTFLSGGNIEKELAKMGTGDHMAMIFMASNGQIPTIRRKNTELLKYPWGAASYDVEHEPKKEEEQRVISPAPVLDPKTAPGQHVISDPAPKQLSWAQKKAAKAEKEAVAAKAAVLVSPPPPPPPTSATVSAIPLASAVSALNLRKVPIPPKFDSGTQGRRKWFSHRSVTLPKGWETMTGTLLVPLELLLKLDSKKTKGQVELQYPAADAADAKEALKNSTADMSGKLASVDGITPKSSATPAVDQPVTIPVEQIKNLMDTFSKKPQVMAYLGKDHKNLMDPALSVLIEDKLPQFWQLLEYPTLESTFHFTEKTYQDMGSSSLACVSKAAFNYKNELIKSIRDREILSARLKKFEGIVSVASDTKVKDIVNTAPIETKVEPAKGSSWAERRAGKKVA